VCGRFTLRTPLTKLIAEFDFSPGCIQYPARYNIAPTQDVGVVRVEGKFRRLHSMRWGMLPVWQKDTGRPLINIRTETLKERATFRKAFEERRGLMLADGFYEWQKTDDGKQPYLFQRKGGKPFAFAALWEPKRGGILAVDSAALITTTPNELVAPAHNRMPVMLDQDSAARWLSPAATTAELLELLSPFPTEQMEAWPVSAKVNSPQFDLSQCAEPIANK
jgi:putative SOS response-associated peptidase YedK